MRYRVDMPLLFVAVLLASPMALGADYVWLVAGAGGEERYSNEFNGSLESISASLIERHGYKAEEVRILGDAPEELDSIREDITLDDLKTDNDRLKEALRVGGEARRLREHPDVRVDVKVEPAALPTRIGDLVIRVAHRREVELPADLRLRGQGLRLAGDGEDRASGVTDGLRNPSLHVATQLVAAGRSPEAAVEDEDHERVSGELLLDPPLPCPPRADAALERAGVMITRLNGTSSGKPSCSIRSISSAIA